jgi:hypothetical protein
MPLAAIFKYITAAIFLYLMEVIKSVLSSSRRDHLVIASTYATSATKSNKVHCVNLYVIKFIDDLLVDGFLQILWFPPSNTKKWLL